MVLYGCHSCEYCIIATYYESLQVEAQTVPTGNITNTYAVVLHLNIKKIVDIKNIARE